MCLKKINLIVLIVILSAMQAYSQSLTSSPYSRYGMGDVYYRGNGHNIAMGGTCVAEANPLYVNTVNPAGNTNLNMQRFVFDVGMDVKYTNTESATASQKNCNTSFSYLAGAFAVKPWWFFSFQMKPFSSVGYAYGDSLSINYNGDISKYEQSHEGKGGLNKLSISTAFKFFKMLSVGAQGSVLFGNLERYSTLSNGRPLGKIDGIYAKALSYTEYSNKFIMHGLQADLGARLEKSIRSRKDTLRDAFKVSLGAYIGYEAKLKSRNEVFSTSTSSVTDSKSSQYTAHIDTLAIDTLFRGDVVIPGGYGVGLSMEFMERVVVNVDYQHHDWSSFALPGQAEASNLREQNYYGAGLQFVADKYSVSKFMKTIIYRVGLHKQETYYKFGDTGIDEKGITFGLGIPIRSLVLNLNFDCGSRGTTEHNLYKEKYFLMSLNITAHDVWFVKRKFH